MGYNKAVSGFSRAQEGDTEKKRMRLPEKHASSNLKIVISLIIIGVVAFLSIGAPYFASADPLAVDLHNVLQPPGQGHLLGTDEMGRDVWSRLLHGGRVSVLVGFTAMLVSICLGTVYGAFSGYAGGIIDRLMMRGVDVMLALPNLFIVIVFMAVAGPSLFNVILIIGFTGWMQTARLVRTEVLSLKQREFVLAARAAGTPLWKQIVKHMLPHFAPTVTVMATVGVGHAMLTETTASFLGLGIPPHQPSWGNMLMGAQSYVLTGAWWVVVFPGAMIVLTVMAVTLLGDWLEERYLRKRNE